MIFSLFYDNINLVSASIKIGVLVNLKKKGACEFMKRRIVNMTRASRRVFAQKARPSISSLRQDYIPRGGGYL